MPSSKTRTKQSFSFLQVLGFAARYWIRQPKKLVLILFVLTIAAFLETYLPSALSSFITAIQGQYDKSAILYHLAIFIGIYFASILLFSLAYLIYNSFETHLFKSLVDDVFTHIYRLPEKFFANTFTGSIISKINRARQKIETFEDQILVHIFPTLIILIGSLVFLSLQFPLLSVLMILYLILLIAITSFFIFKISGPAQGVYARAQDDFNAHVADSLSGVTTTKSYAQEKYELFRFLKVTRYLRSKNLRAYHRGNLARFIQGMLLTGMLVILMGGGTWYFLRGEASVASMAYLVFAYSIMQSYIREVGENIKNLLTSSYDLHGVMELLAEEPEVPLEMLLPELNIQQGEIIFNNIEFTYPDKKTPIFKDFSVTIGAGERIALVGHSGSGKTSFIRLLQLLYPIQKGQILIDGQDIQKGSRRSLRSAIGLVPQEPILFHRSLRDNIAYATPFASDADIFEAARKAHIEKFILSLPEQYETLVGERGIKLSGGERQRIAIARAILANRPILILDEATSSLDSESERAIQEALHVLIQGRTSIMIAHRLSTILDADRILVFDSGRIVEQGSHAELILHNGIYANLFKMQSGGLLST